MASKLELSSDASKSANRLILADTDTNWSTVGLEAQGKTLLAKFAAKVNSVTLHTEKGTDIVLNITPSKEGAAQQEVWRRAGAAAVATSTGNKVKELALTNASTNKEAAYFVAEGLLLGNYKFAKYKTTEKESTLLEALTVDADTLTAEQLSDIQHIVEATFAARDLVNEPLSFLTAEQLSLEIERLGAEAGFKVEIFNEAKIQSLKMGGLLAVNRGSQLPPTFSILEWKPAEHKNAKPIVLVGKGVVYDTGGLSLKPTPNSMDFMKSDMGGAAAVVGAIYAAAKAKLPVHIIGLVPATDNRPGEDAYVPGDVIKMHSGLNVEVLNTDAEGRMLLADALSYAKKYDPELVIDLATLTGAAARAVGPQGVVYMGTADEDTKFQLESSSYNVHERLIELPLWEEYNDMIKSDIADINNVGGPAAGAITAGMFLKHFVSYPWVHIDIASMAWMDRNDGYRLKNGTGVGVRLLFDFLKNLN